jgi:GNAT superfamily N-acetyltransferase
MTEARHTSDFVHSPLPIRLARKDDLATLVEIEAAAGVSFRDLGMDAVADDDPGSVEELVSYAETDRGLVAVDSEDRPVGYLLLDVVDSVGHIAQVSVHPDHTRQGIGHALIERAACWACSRGFDALTLTTYREVPWNGPYYERLGFAYLTYAEETRGLRAIRERERRRGLDTWPRACMRLRLGLPK